MEEPIQKVKVLTVKPKYIPIVCPTCRGYGTLKYGAKICNGCDGKTYILVDAEEVQNGK